MSLRSTISFLLCPCEDATCTPAVTLQLSSCWLDGSRCTTWTVKSWCCIGAAFSVDGEGLKQRQGQRTHRASQGTRRASQRTHRASQRTRGGRGLRAPAAGDSETQSQGTQSRSRRGLRAPAAEDPFNGSHWVVTLIMNAGVHGF
eukprot:365886-Chlamydomonas_euryale.AAC.10